MVTSHSMDPRARRTRAALQSAYKAALKEKPYTRIIVTDITQQAGVARHTFYNHYESKQDLMVELIDSVLRQFFSGLDEWHFLLADGEEELRMYRAFFQAWKDNAEILQLLDSVDIDILIIERLKVFFNEFYHDRVKQEMPAVELALARYVISFNAYSLLGILKPWFDSGLNHQPDDLAAFMILLTGAKQRRKAVEKFAEVFKV